MKRKYRMTALLGSLMMLGACTAGMLPVQAEQVDSDHFHYSHYSDFTRLDNGDAGVRLHEGLDGTVVITDAKGLDVSLFDGCIIYEETGSPEWVQNLPASMQAADNRYYVVNTRPTIYRDERGAIQIPFSNLAFRHIMVETDNIREIIGVSREMDGIVQWGGDFVAGLVTGYPEDAEKSKVDVSTFSGYEEALQELNTSGLSGYDLLLAADAKSYELLHDNGDKCGYVMPTETTTGFYDTIEYGYSDIWEDVGDIDGLNGTDATDAAEILIAAAAYGADGKYDDFDLYDRKPRADVNADGQIDADDAAIVLRYAAAVGAGQAAVSIRDFIP